VSGPRILLWDLETSHNLAAVFRLYGEDYIPPDNLVQERYIICAAWKWFGEKGGIQTVSVLDDHGRYKTTPHDDRHVVRTLYTVLSQADVIVAHNGDSYDFPFFNGRAIYQGLPKLPPIKSVDTKKVAKRHFLFNANSLDYLGQFLKLGRKISTPKGLWMRVLNGDAKAIETMVRYNKGDIRLLEKVFKKFLPFVADAIGRDTPGCPRCGSRKVQSRGVHRAVARVYTRYQCQACAGWFRGDVLRGQGPKMRLVA